jgi:hypothetical protein
MGGSGGGVSGEVSFPAYIETIHEDWLYGAGPSNLSSTIEGAMNTAFAADPYSNYSYSNPSTALAANDTSLALMHSNVSAAVYTTDFGTLIDRAAAKADECDIDQKISVKDIINRQIGLASNSMEEAMELATTLAQSTVIDDLIEAQRRSSRINRARRISRYKAGMADIGAVHSSAFYLGLGSIYAQEEQAEQELRTQLSARLFEQGLNQWANLYSTNLRVDGTISGVNKNARTQTLLSGMQLLKSMHDNKIIWQGDVARLTSELNRVRYLTTADYEKNELDLDVFSSNWELDVFGRGISQLGGMAGYAHPLPSGPSRASATIGGVLSGAAAGATVGSVVPGVGTAIGAGVGALLGGLGGLLG